MTIYGHTSKGVPIDDAWVGAVAAQAEAGFRDWDLKVGRPSLGSAGRSPSRTVRLPGPLDAALLERSRTEHTTPSAIIRQALHEFLAPTG
jgi:hypothetical protein